MTLLSALIILSSTVLGLVLLKWLFIIFAVKRAARVLGREWRGEKKK